MTKYLAWQNQLFGTRQVVHSRVRYPRSWFGRKTTFNLFVWRAQLQVLEVRPWVLLQFQMRALMSTIHKSHQHGRKRYISAITSCVMRPISTVPMGLEYCHIVVGAILVPGSKFQWICPHEISTSTETNPHCIHQSNGFGLLNVLKLENLAEHCHGRLWQMNYRSCAILSELLYFQLRKRINK